MPYMLEGFDLLGTHHLDSDAVLGRHFPVPAVSGSSSVMYAQPRALLAASHVLILAGPSNVVSLSHRIRLDVALLVLYIYEHS